MANREIERINYHSNTKGAIVLRVSPSPRDLIQFDDSGRVIRPVVGGSGDLPLEGKEHFNLQQKPENKKAR